MTVKDIVVFLDKLGMWDIIVPFVFVFTVVFAVLEKTKVLGEEAGEPKHRFNAVIAFVIGAFTLLAVDVLNLVTRFSQYIVVILVMVVCLVMLTSFFGFKDMGSTKLGKRIILPVLFVVLVIGMLYAFGWMNVLNWSAVSDYIGVLIGLAVFLLVIWIILREPKGQTTTDTTTHTPAAPTPAPAPAPGPGERLSEEQQKKSAYEAILQNISSEQKEQFKQDYENHPDDQKLPFLRDVAQHLGLIRKQQ